MQKADFLVTLLISWIKVCTKNVLNFRTPKLFSVIILKLEWTSFHGEFCLKDANGMANIAYPDQTAPDLGLHYLPKSSVPKT